MNRRQRARLIRFGVYALTLALVAAVAVLADWAAITHTFLDVEIARGMFPRVLTVAARNTVIFTLFAFAGGITLGLALALLRLSTVRAYRWFAATFIEVFRGLPALLTIMLVGYALPISGLLRIPRDLGPSIFGLRLPGEYLPGAVALSIVAAAYMAETIRAGIVAVPRGQMEAARSLGMTAPRAMLWIVIPQAFRIIIPPLTNEFVLLLKDTSLLFVLGTTSQTLELVRFANAEVSDTFNATPIVVVGLVYLVITIPLTRLSAALERGAAQAH